MFNLYFINSHLLKKKALNFFLSQDVAANLEGTVVFRESLASSGIQIIFGRC